MADFFTRLAERALGVRPTARPVVPSVFTPLAPARPVFGDLSPESWSESRVMSEASSDAETRSAPPLAITSDRVAGRTTPTSPSLASKVQKPKEASHQAPVAPSIPPPSLGPADSPQKDMVRQGTVSQPNFGERLQPRLTPADDVRGEVTAPLRHEPEPGRADAPAGEFAPPVGVPRIVEPLAHPANAAARNETGDSPALSTAHGYLPARLATARERPTSSPAATRPTVRVTIGRVDVHAIFPERGAPPARLAASSPTLSLDEYLNQRRGGQR